MGNLKTNDDLARAVRRLFIICVLIGVLLALNLGFSIVLFALRTDATQHLRSLPCRNHESGRPEHIRIDDLLANASVVALARWKVKGDRHQAVISEILKQTATVDFPYKVGDEIRGESRPIDGVDYGEGEVVFFEGSPAKACYFVAYSDGRLRDAQQTTLEAVREVLRR